MSRRVRRAALLVLAVALCGCGGSERDPARREADLRSVAPADPVLARAESLDVAGESLAALDLARQALNASERLHGPESTQAAAAMTVVARLVHAQGDFDTARRLDQAALAMRRRVFGERHPLVAQSLLQLASDVKNSGGPLPEALALCRQSLLLRRELLPPGSREVGESLMGLGNMYRAMNRPDSAKAALLEALELRRRLAPPEPDAVAATLTALSLVYTQASDWRAAEPLLREAVALRRALPRPRTGRLEMSLSTYGMTLRNLSRSAGAESVLTECATLREELRRGAARGRGRAAMFDLSVYWQLAAAQLEQDRGAAAWVSVERGMSRTLIESLHDRGELDTLGMWRDALGRVQRRLAPDAAIIGWLELKRGAGREGYPMWAYAIRKHGPVRWHRIDGPAGDMWHGSSDVLYGYKGELRAAAGWPLRLADTTEAARLGRAIYALRIAPLEPDLEGARRLIVVSPDIMRGIPLESLADTAGRWLGDRFEIAYTPSALLDALRSGRGARDQAPRAWRALLVGDPAFAASGAAVKSSARGAAGGGTMARAATAAVAAWPPLGATRPEINAIAALLPGATTLLGRDASEAKLRELAASGALAHYDLIHFATHAAIDERSPGRSALVLSESAGPGVAPAAADAGTALAGEPRVDGLLTVDEIASQWRLDARLVSLAACSSVLGPVSHVEGYIGFEPALLGAGARALLVSLWHVDDEATGLLMRRFYGNLLAGQGSRSAGSRTTLSASEAAPRPMRASTAAALREAQHWLRTLPGPSGGHPYAHPVYWAGLVLVGDPE